MNRAVLRTVWWSHHVFGSDCSGCRKWIYPIPILREFTGFSGGMRIGADGKGHGFNFRFCSEACVENFKVRRLEENWNGPVESLAYSKRKHQEEKERRANERPWKQDREV